MAYMPKQGDIIKMCFNPTLGHEQQGNHRPALKLHMAKASGFLDTDKLPNILESI